MNVHGNAVCSQTRSSKATHGVQKFHPQYLLSMFCDSKVHWPPGLQGPVSLWDAHSLGRGNTGANDCNAAVQVQTLQDWQEQRACNFPSHA